MKLTVILFILLVSSIGCATTDSPDSQAKNQSEKIYFTGAQAKVWRSFEDAVYEFNAVRQNPDRVICTPRKRDGGRFAYIHCEFHKELNEWNKPERGLERMQRGF
ncbi:MAG: hypothetical protein AAF465_04300 [Pseudomonadota bacterium]